MTEEEKEAEEKDHSKRIRRIRQAIVLLLVVVRVFIVDEVDQATVSSRKFVAVCEEIRRGMGCRPLCFWGLGPDGDDNKYLLHVRRDRIFIPHSLENLEELEALPSGSLIVVRLERWEHDVPETERNRWFALARGRIGRRDCALMTAKFDNPKDTAGTAGKQAEDL